MAKKAEDESNTSAWRPGGPRHPAARLREGNDLCAGQAFAQAPQDFEAMLELLNVSDAMLPQVTGEPIDIRLGQRADRVDNLVCAPLFFCLAQDILANRGYGFGLAADMGHAAHGY